MHDTDVRTIDPIAIGSTRYILPGALTGTGTTVTGTVLVGPTMAVGPTVPVVGPQTYL